MAVLVAAMIMTGKSEGQHNSGKHAEEGGAERCMSMMSCFGGLGLEGVYKSGLQGLHDWPLQRTKLERHPSAKVFPVVPQI